ncbi:MAG TPA: efflux RND transporter periplasmic adaptor subunit [Methylomirabilota bacterium]|nr:efflux RND transporter periplasmic adaptor subunit [Methylomirabilota bacterium]
MRQHNRLERERRAAAWLFALLILSTTAACDRANSAKVAAPPPPPTPVIVAEVVQRSVPIVREYTARTEGVPTIEVRARVAGVLEEVLFQEGSEVKQGQTLFTIQREEYAAQLESARAQLAKAQADLIRARDTSVVDRVKAQLNQRKADLGKAQQDVNRYRPLAQARAIPQQDLDTALSQEQVAIAGVEAAEAALKDAELAQRTQIQLGEAAVNSAKAAVTQAQLNVDYTTVKSPVTGVVGKVQVDRGNLVGKSEPTLLATVSAIDPIYADFPLAEVDYLKLAPRIQLDPSGRVQSSGPALTLILADGRTFPHKGRVVFVDRAVDVKTGTINIRASFPNPEKVVRPGQFARVRGVVEERPNAVLVPQRAVMDQQGTKIVFAVGADDKVVLKPVALDERIDDTTIVTKGLAAGERVIVEGMQKVRPGMQVKPERAAMARPAVPAGGPAPAAAPAPGSPGAPAPAKSVAPTPPKPASGG